MLRYVAFYYRRGSRLFVKPAVLRSRIRRSRKGDTCGDCCPSKTLVFDASVSPAAPPFDTAVAVGASIVLSGRGEVQTQDRQCRNGTVPLSARSWSLTYTPRGGDAQNASNLLTGTDTDAAFVPRQPGLYEAFFVSSPPPDLPNPPNWLQKSFRIWVVGESIAWVSVGPDGTKPDGTADFGGRFNTLAIDPRNARVMYAGSGRGGVWKTASAGQWWYPLTDSRNFASLAVGALAVDSRGAIYVGSGDPYDPAPNTGNGIYVSEDNGRSWNRMMACASSRLGSATLLQGTYWRLLADSSNPPSVYAAGDTGLLRLVRPNRANNFTATCWQQILPRVSTVTDVAFDPTDSRRLYAAVPGWGLVATDDRSQAALAWRVELADPPRSGGPPPGDSDARAAAPSQMMRVAVASDGSLYLALGRGRAPDQSFAVWRKAAGAAGWRTTDLSSFRNQKGELDPKRINCWGNPCTYNMAIAVNPRDPRDVFFATVAIFRSTNGGDNWTWVQNWDRDGARSALADTHDLIVGPGTGGGSTLYSVNDGGVAAASILPPAPGGPGISWTHLNRGLAVTEVYDLATAPSNPQALAIHLQDDKAREFQTGSVWSAIPNSENEGYYVAYDAADTIASCWRGDCARSLIYYHDGGFGGFIESTRSAAGPLGYVRGLWADPRRSGVLFSGGVANWSVLNVSFNNNRTDGNGVQSAPVWSCVHPDDAGSLKTVAFSRSVAANAAGPAVYAGLDNGNLWMVEVQGQPTGVICPPPNSDDSLPLRRDRIARQVFPRGANPGVVRINDVVEDPFNPCTVYATVDVTDPSLDQWRVIRMGNPARDCPAPPPPIPMAATLPPAATIRITADPTVPDTLYVGTYNGLIVGQQCGQNGCNWRRSTSFPATQVMALRPQPSGQSFTGQVFAGTFGRGVWRRVYTPSQRPPDLPVTTGVAVSRCEAHMLGGVTENAGRSAHVIVDYTNRSGAVSARVSATRRGQAAPEIRGETRALKTGTGTAQMLLGYSSVAAPPESTTDGLRVAFLDAAGRELSARACSFNAHWVNSKTSLLRVEAVRHAREGGSAPALTSVQIAVGQQPPVTLALPAEIAVPARSPILVSRPSEIAGTQFSAWHTRGAAYYGESIRLTMTSDQTVTAAYVPLSWQNDRKPRQ